MQTVQEIETVLARVLAGHLSVEAAVDELLRVDAAHPQTRPTHVSLSDPHASSPDLAAPRSTHSASTNRMPLRSLVEQFGPPPQDVIAAWRASSQSGIDLPEDARVWSDHDLNRWAIDASGCLVLLEDEPDLGQAVQAEITRPLALAVDASPVTLDTEPTFQATPRRDSTPKTSAQRIQVASVGIAATVVCVCLAAWALRNAYSSRPEPMTNSPPSFAPLAQASLPRSTSEDPAASPEPVVLEVLEPQEDLSMESSAPDGSLTDSGSVEEATLSLDSLLPPADSFMDTTAGVETSIDHPATGDTASSSIRDTPESEADAVLADGNDDGDLPEGPTDDPAPPEANQPTRETRTRAAILPPVADVNAITSLDAASLDARLEFPIETSLRKQPGTSPETFSIVDSRTNQTVAELFKQATGIGFRWSPQASDLSAAGALFHGRLADGHGRSIYFRPQIEADPMPIRFDQSDAQPTWDLVYPIPPNVTSLRLNVVIPDSIDLAWIEPFDEASIRRGRGLAIFTPKDGESVSLGMRMDIRCARKLSIRLRYAARLDPSLPWQPFSRDALQASIDQLGTQSMLASQQATQIESLYSRADTSERRQMRSRRDAAKSRAEDLKSILQRANELARLAALLETAAQLELTVVVQWPDDQQVLLKTVQAHAEPTPP